MAQGSFTFGPPPERVFTVSDITDEIRKQLASSFSNISVTGEVSGCKQYSSGHYYFSLKDGSALLRCVLFKSSARYLKVKPEDGLKIKAKGSVEVYRERGEYQLMVQTIEPIGEGALLLAFEQLKQRLTAEGLFAQERKRALPALPRNVGIVTSPSGAVIQDMITILGRRFPGLQIRLYPAQVQGAGAAETVIRGINYFSENEWADVVIVGRGGGSLEDLWTFNEESVARAIAACRVPVVSAVGHETDFTIADFVADLRAPTPSAAAELIICTRDSLLERIAGCEWKAQQAIRYRLSSAARRLHELGLERTRAIVHRKIDRGAQRIDDLENTAREMMRSQLAQARHDLVELDARLRRQDIRLRFAEARRRLERLDGLLKQAVERRLAVAAARLAPEQAHLKQLNPLAILERGYAVVLTDDKKVVRDAAALTAEQRVRVKVSRGEFEAKVI